MYKTSTRVHTCQALGPDEQCRSYEDTQLPTQFQQSRIEPCQEVEARLS